MGQFKPPSSRSCSNSSLFYIGKDSHGNWVAQDQKGLRGGLFVDRTEALRYALFENGNEPRAVVMVPGVFELDMSRKVGEAGRPAIGATRPQTRQAARTAHGAQPPCPQQTTKVTQGDAMFAIGRHVSKLSSYAPAIPTPFDDEGNIDTAALERFCHLQVKAGATALVVCGTTGEAPTLNPAEHRELICVAVSIGIQSHARHLGPCMRSRTSSGALRRSLF